MDAISFVWSVGQFRVYGLVGAWYRHWGVVGVKFLSRGALFYFFILTNC